MSEAKLNTTADVEVKKTRFLIKKRLLVEIAKLLKDYHVTVELYDNEHFLIIFF